MSRSDDLQPLEDLQRRIGYRFRDISLLERALTHGSLSSLSGDIRSLERLEFLGDRVLGLLTAEELWRRYPDFSEGDMAPRLNALVRKESCARAARAMGLGVALRLSPSEEEAGGRDKTAILGDACEALLGALYVDGGLEAARKAYGMYWLQDFDRLASRYKDAKTSLQEWSQSVAGDAPYYDVLKRKGPAHQPYFVVEVKIPGFAAASGEGPSKRAAQMSAAQSFLLREGIWTEADID